MLRVCTEQEFEKYSDYVYSLSIDPTKAGYPSYSDGIKTKEMFIERSQKAFLLDTEEILLFEYCGEVEGWIHYYYIPEDKYLQTLGVNIRLHTQQALTEFLEYVSLQFNGYELFSGFSAKNKQAIEFFLSHGFELTEEDNNNTGFLKQYKPVNVGNGIVRITKDNYTLFKVLHHKKDTDLYWNSDRIFEDIENWSIFVKMQDNEPLGSIYYKIIGEGWFEIFGIDLKDNIFDEKVIYDLLGTAMNTAKELNGTYMTLFCGDEEQKVADKIGFTLVDKYVCYKKLL